MSLVDELREMEQHVARRLKELEPLVAEYKELREIADRIGGEVASAAAPPRTERDGSARSRAKRVPKATGTRRASKAGGKPASKPAAAKNGATASNGKLRGRRDEEIIRMVKQQPGITVAQVGKELGVDATGLYRVIRRLQASGVISKQGRALQPATTD
jgi:hypothetical protein